MDDLLDHLGTALWSFLDKAAAFGLELLAAAGRKLLEGTAALAGRLDGWAAKVAAVPLWISLPVGLCLLALVGGWLVRQQLYDRILIYHLFWLRRRGFARQTFVVRRGAVRQTHQAMARRVALPARFGEIAVYEVVPDRYGVAYGRVAGLVEDVRFYRRDLHAGLRAMGSDLMAYYRANARLLHADAEVRALFAILDVRDRAFAANRPLLPGESTIKTAPDPVSEAVIQVQNGDAALADRTH